jgi:hypothetical protein
MDELEKLKTSVDQLGHARLIDWAILTAGMIAAIASALISQEILVFIDIFAYFSLKIRSKAL